MNDYHYKYEKHYRYLTNICLNVTDACNLKCKYCFVAQNPHFMDFITAKAAADWLHDNLNKKRELGVNMPNEKCSINFFGGEPMLLYDKIMKPLVEYCEEEYPDEFTFGMTTNGTLLNEEKVKWLHDHNFGLLLSIDGAKETQDFNRPCQDETQSSFDLVMKNIPYILQYFPNITFRSTLDQESVEHMFENYLFAEQLGFKNYFFIPNGREIWSPESVNQLAAGLEQIFEYIKDKYLNHEQVLGCSVIDEAFMDVIQQSRIMTGLDYPPDLNEVKYVVRCGLGTGMGSIGYDGSIYGCQEQDSKGKDSTFYLGNIFKDGIDPVKHDKLLKKYAYSGKIKCDNRELCYNNCFLKMICQRHTCPSTNIDMFNDMAIMPEIHCVWRNLLFFNALKVYYFLYSQNVFEFNNYISRLSQSFNNSNNFKCDNCQMCNSNCEGNNS